MSSQNCSTAFLKVFIHDLMKYNGHPFRYDGISLFINVPILAAIRLDVTYLKTITVFSNIEQQYVKLYLCLHTAT